MPHRVAAILALIAFAFCLFVGGWQADNPFATTVIRALAAMAVTWPIGLVIGHMTKTMINESTADAVDVPDEKPKLNPKPKPGR